jgi:hypothetical protein
MLCVLSGNHFTKRSIPLVRRLTKKKIPGIICQLERGKHPEESAGFMKVPRGGEVPLRWGKCRVVLGRGGAVCIGAAGMGWWWPLPRWVWAGAGRSIAGDEQSDTVRSDNSFTPHAGPFYLK